MIQNLPFLAANIPPVTAPLIIEFHGSSFFLIWTKVQSIVLNIPPHTAKFPAIIGDLALIAVKLPSYKLINKGNTINILYQILKYINILYVQI